MKPIYSVIVPVYNEEQVIEESYKRIKYVMDSLSEEYEILFINDGSRDNTVPIIEKICENDSNIHLVKFSRNFGHQAAITAGMDYSRGDAVIVIDADLQDPPEVMLQMIETWKSGYDVVYGRRIKRIGETVFKKWTAKAYYRVLASMTNVDIPVDTGDFRLLDRKVVETMCKLQEKNRYVRGLVSWVGYRQTAVEFVREERFAGETKYPLKKMLKFALDGITAFSYKPLKLATGIGMFFSASSFIYLLVIIYQRLFTDTTITGWASMTGILLLTQGIVLMMLGIIGEYIGRMYEEIKDRPLYIVDEVINSSKETNPDEIKR